MNSTHIPPRKGEGPDARQRSEPSGTATTHLTDCAPAEPNAQGVSGLASQLIKANELSVILLLQAEREDDEIVECSCCGESWAKSDVNQRIVSDGDRWLLAFICPRCENQTNATGGANIKHVSLIDSNQVDKTLLDAYKWLDSTLLQKFQWKPFIRRPTFAEREQARSAGAALPHNAAVVVARHGDCRLTRRLMPMPFPWRDDQEWMAGPIAAQDALDLAEAIGRGEVDMLEVGGNVMFFSSSETLGRLVAGS